jgi:hypothetical protein
MLGQITPEQFDEWLAFGLQIEPFGFENEWLQIGTIASMIFAAGGGKGEGQKPSAYIPTMKENTHDEIEAFRRFIETRYK